MRFVFLLAPSFENQQRMTSSFLNWCLSNNFNWNKALPRFLSLLPCCFLHCAESPSDGNACTLLLICEGKRSNSTFLSMQSACSPPVMIFVEENMWLEDYCDSALFCPPASPLADPFPQVPVLRLADRRIVCLPRIVFCKLISKPYAHTSYSCDKADYLRSSWTQPQTLFGSSS